ncbi:MAG: 16S rRNA (cytosine(967)-C(5))-methyltransferase RsmB [bacterium]|nr:16S rRNA (cytosine(967)-C(5))-methyltransferase RsmB [bacterium]
MSKSSTRKPSARLIAYQVLLRVEQDKAYAGLALDSALAKSTLSNRDKRLVTELVYGTIRHQGTIDWLIGQYANKSDKWISLKLKLILRLGAYQLLYLNKIPEFAAVHETVKLAKQSGLTKFAGVVNAVLRRLAEHRDRIEYPDKTVDMVRYLSVKYSHPEWIIRIFLSQFGVSETEHLLAVNNQPAPITLRVNQLKCTVNQVEQLLTQANLDVVKHQYVSNALQISRLPRSIQDLPGYQEGYFTVQDPASILVADLVHPKPGQTIVDLCAAPGGKATRLAELMQNQGKLFAIDLHPKKAKLIEQTAVRLGLTNIKVIVADATRLNEIISEPVDAVLVDAPCSGLGVLRRKVDSRWRKQPTTIPELVRLQERLLESAYQILKPGGVLVYSTCTLTKEENELQVSRFLQLHPDMHLGLAKGYLPSSAVELITKEGYYLALPHKHGTDGIFAARMIKKTSSGL